MSILKHFLVPAAGSEMFQNQKECQSRVLVNFPEIQLRLKPSLASERQQKRQDCNR